MFLLERPYSSFQRVLPFASTLLRHPPPLDPLRLFPCVGAMLMVDAAGPAAGFPRLPLRHEQTEQAAAGLPEFRARCGLGT